jgi:hypothetical protein
MSLYRKLQPTGLPVIIVEAPTHAVSLTTMRDKPTETTRGIARSCGRAGSLLCV